MLNITNAVKLQISHVLSIGIFTFELDLFQRSNSTSLTFFFTVNIFEMVNQLSSMTFQLTYLHLILTHSRCRRHGRAHLDSEHLVNGDRSDKITIAIKQYVIYGISIGIFTFDLGPFKDQGQGHAYSLVNILKMVTDRKKQYKQEVFRLSYLHLTLPYSKGH